MGLTVLADEANLLPGGKNDPFLRAGDKAKEAGDIQADSARKGLDFQKESIEQIRSDLAPFVDVGTGSAGKLFGAVQDPNARVLNNPFFTALSQDQQNRLSGTAGINVGGEVFDRNLMLSGNQLAQQDINNLTDLTALGQASALGLGAQEGESAAQQSQLLEQVGGALASGAIGRGNAIGQAGQTGLGIIGALAAFSDIRLKEDPKPVGIRNGVVYYVWKWTKEALEFVGDQEAFGVMAQEVMLTHPDAVIIDRNGWFRVNYARLV